MHGRTRCIALAAAFACAFPAAAAAAPIPAGVYDTQLTSGTLTIGLLPQIPLPQSPSFPLTIGTSPLNAQLNSFALPAQPINANVGVGTVSGTYTVGVENLAIALDPTTGDATIGGGVYVSVALTFTPLIGSPTSGNCTVGTPAQPVAINLSSANGSSFDPTTNAMTVVDKTFVVPAPTCDSSLSLIAGAVGALIGGTTPGSNVLSMVFTLLRRPDATTPQTTSGGTGATGGSGGTGGTQQNGSSPSGSTQTGSATACVVPKLKGKRLATRKAKTKTKQRLNKAGCKLGKVKKAKSKKRKGTVLKQTPAPGKRLPAGTRINLTVSRG